MKGCRLPMLCLFMPVILCDPTSISATLIQYAAMFCTHIHKIYCKYFQQHNRIVIQYFLVDDSVTSVHSRCDFIVISSLSAGYRLHLDFTRHNLLCSEVPCLCLISRCKKINIFCLFVETWVARGLLVLIKWGCDSCVHGLKTIYQNSFQ